MFDFLTTCRALADENRIRILMALRPPALRMPSHTFLDLAPSTTSKHLSILRQARLIESNKQGRWVYYRLADDSPRPNIREALAWMKDSLANDPTIIEDEARIAEILRAEEACGFGHGESDCFHSLEVHSLAQRFENAPQEEKTMTKRYAVHNLRCAGCAARIEDAIAGPPRREIRRHQPRQRPAARRANSPNSRR